MADEAANVPELRFPGFEGEWEPVELSESVVSLDAGVSVNSIDRKALKTELGILKTSCVTRGVFECCENKAVTDANEIRRLKEHVVEDSIIISRMNTPALVGANAYVPKTSKRLYLPDRLWAAKPSPTASMKFIAYVLGYGKTRRVLSNLGTGTSGSMKNISKSDVLALKISAPKKVEQQKIATFLGAVDGKIGQLEKKKALLEDYKKGCMQKLFSRTFRFKDDNGNDFPDWEEKRLGDYCDIISGYAVAGEDILENTTKIRLLRGINITEGAIRHSKDMDRFLGASIKGLERFLVQTGDIVVGMDGSKVGRNVAVVGVEDADSFLIQRVARLRDNGANYLAYAYHHIFSILFHRYVDRINTSSGIPHISLNQLREFAIQSPNILEQQKIANFLTAIDDKITLTTTQLTQAQKFKKGLLQQMFV